MNIHCITGLLPGNYRRRSVKMAVAVLLKALLDFAGVAALLSVLLVLLQDADGQRYAVWAALAGLLFLIAKNAAGLWLDRFQNRYLLALYRYFSARLLDHYYRCGLLFVRERGPATLAHEVNYVCYAFVLNVLAPLLRMVGEALLLLLLLTGLFVYSPLAALWLTVCFLPLVGGYMYVMHNRVTRYGEAENRAKRRQWQVVQELFRGYVEIETNQAYDRVNDRFQEGMEEISRNRVRLGICQQLPSAVMETGMAMALLVLLVTGGEGDALLGTLAVFGTAAFRILPGVRSLLGGWMQIYNNRFTVDTLTAALSKENIPVVQEEKLIFRQEIQVEHLSFAYPGTEEFLIRNFSFSIRQGEVVGLRGISGVGKTTLFHLLLGFFTPYAGEIHIDGTRLTAANRRAWQRMVGYVPQEVFIFDGTVIENIVPALLPEKADSVRVQRVLEQVRLDAWVASLPEGMATRLGENGCRISGGQRQRLGIARALYKGAKVLFFDEATSALDSRTEEEVTAVIRELADAGELTLLMVAHRESSLQICDRIIQLGND